MPTVWPTGTSIRGEDVCGAAPEALTARAGAARKGSSKTAARHAAALFRMFLRFFLQRSCMQSLLSDYEAGVLFAGRSSFCTKRRNTRGKMRQRCQGSR
jgi:hypothetical protein